MVVSSLVPKDLIDVMIAVTILSVVVTSAEVLRLARRSA
jgi:hypothetical protein